MGLGLWSRRMCGPSATPPSSVGWIHDSLLEAKDCGGGGGGEVVPGYQW